MRHGESFANRRGLIASKAVNALDNYGLTSIGKEQTNSAAASSVLTSQTIIISSDYLRARETAETVAKELLCDTPVTLSALLRERDFGQYELSNDTNYSQVWKHDLHHPNGSKNSVETVTQVLARMNRLITDLERKFESEQLLLVSHGDVLQILDTQYRGLNPALHRSIPPLGNAEIRQLGPN